MIGIGLGIGVGLGGATPAAAHPLRANALAFWDLDSDSTDKTGHSHTGSDTSVTYDGTFASFASAAAQIALTGISVGATFTWSCWVNSPLAAVAGGYNGIFADNGGSNGIYILTGSGNKIDLFFGGADHLSSTGVTSSTLTHIVLSCNAGTVTFYVNGVSAGTVSGWTAHTLAYLGNDNVGDYLGVGIGTGKMRCAGLFSDAKNSAWVTSMFNGGTPLKWASM